MKKISDVDGYLVKDNIRKLSLIDMLRRKSYLKGLTIKELEDLMSSVNTLLGNIEFSFKKGKIKIETFTYNNKKYISLKGKTDFSKRHLFHCKKCCKIKRIK